MFPFNSNLIHTRGLGPVTLTDEFYLGADPYLIRSRAFWRGVTYVVIGASILWGLPVATAGAWRGTSTSRLEGLAFSAAFVGLSLAADPASLWTRRLRSLRLSAGDRRGVPAGDLARAQRGSVGRAAAAQPARESRCTRSRWRRSRSSPSPARTTTSAGTTRAGASSNARAGWECPAPASTADTRSTAGSRSSRSPSTKNPSRPAPASGTCQCDLHSGIGWLWNCYDDSYRVGTVLRDEYQEIARIQPHYWFGAGPPLILSKRPK